MVMTLIEERYLENQDRKREGASEVNLQIDKSSRGQKYSAVALANLDPNTCTAEAHCSVSLRILTRGCRRVRKRLGDISNMKDLIIQVAVNKCGLSYLSSTSFCQQQTTP